MKNLSILLVSPVSTDSPKGNQVTTERWHHHLTNLGHEVTITQSYSGQNVDGMIALHARKSAPAIKAFDEMRGDEFLIVGLGGTDIYRDYPDSAEAVESIERADRLVVLQPRAIEELPVDLQEKGRTIYQSVLNPPVHTMRPNPDQPNTFQILSVAHIRPVKDPIRLPLALKEIPDDTGIRGFHLGAILDESCGEEFLEIADNQPNFDYMGELSREKTLQMIRGADALVISSRLEGGANVVSEAIVLDTPVLASDIPGNRGMLGEDYSGYFPVGDDDTLRKLILRIHDDNDFYSELTHSITKRQTEFQPDLEQKRWKHLLEELHTDSLRSR